MNKGSCMTFFPESFGEKEAERTLVTLVHFFEKNLKILPGTSLGGPVAGDSVLPTQEAWV